jgi:hypothetical protein
MTTDSENSIFPRVYEINISNKIGEDYLPMIDDISRLLVLQLVIHLMYFLRNPYEYNFIDFNFFELIIYIIMGSCVYWLLFKRLIRII